MKYLLMVFCLCSYTLVFAQGQDLYEFDKQSQQQSFNQLLSELRCLVCQNQNILDSNAPFAKDIKKKVYTFYLDGQSDEFIKEYLVTRYGEFILFKPRLEWATYLLWFLPIIILMMAVVVFLKQVLRLRVIE